MMTSQPEQLRLQPDVLRWVRERAELTDDALAHKVNLKVERVLEWERSGQISMAWAERLADATHTPLGYLFLTFPPYEPLPMQDFRTRDNASLIQPSADLLETVYAMQRRRDWIREELIDTGAEPLDFVGAHQPNGNYGAVATAMRSALLLDDDWAASVPTRSDAIRLLRDNADGAGILVVFNGVVGNNTSRKLDPDEFQGFALVDEYAPLVFVNNADYKAAQMFTLAHELAHIFIGEEGLSAFDTLLPSGHDVEQTCNKIAAEFLVPEAAFLEFWSYTRASRDPYQQMARHFKVSRIVTARRALDLGLIDRDAFFDFYNAHKAQGNRSQQNTDGGNFWNTQRWRIGVRFASAVVRAVRAGRLPYREAYALTGLSGDTFANMPEKMGIRL